MIYLLRFPTKSHIILSRKHWTRIESDIWTISARHVFHAICRYFCSLLSNGPKIRRKIWSAIFFQTIWRLGIERNRGNFTHKENWLWKFDISVCFLKLKISPLYEYIHILYHWLSLGLYIGWVLTLAQIVPKCAEI